MIKNFICDVDGCLTDGKIYWDETGRKMFKAFGNYDADGLKLLRSRLPDLNIMFITADRAGFAISKSRIQHMGFNVSLVPEEDRYDFVAQYDFDLTAYMGDGYWDAPILSQVCWGIAPAQARLEARACAHYVTPSAGGEGAVMDACLFILSELGEEHAL